MSPLIIATICAYNEEDKIGQTVSEAKKHTDKVIVIDDNSTDNTSTIAKSSGADIVIRHVTNLGQGAAIRDGLDRAYQEGASVAITIDGDFQHDPSDIPAVISPILNNQYDVVLGSRFLKNKNNMPLPRLVFNIVFSLFYRILFDFKVVDSQTGFRAFNRKAMEAIKLRTNRYDWTCEMADLIIRNNLRYTEVPVKVRYFGKAHQANIIDGLGMFWGMISYFINNKLLSSK